VPRYVAVVETPLSVADAFAFMSDMRMFPSWDSSMVRAVQVVGTGPGPQAEVDLTFAGIGPLRTLRYRVTSYVTPREMVIEAGNRFLTSYDLVKVDPTPTGSRVTYDARLDLRVPGPVSGVVLGVPFRVLGSRAEAGLRAALRADEAQPAAQG
jgi:hypothetical protein